MVPTSSTDPAAAADLVQADAELLARHGARLLTLARQSIGWRLQHNDPLEVDPAHYPPELSVRRASFVTLTKAGQLRGCVGTPPTSAWCSLVQDVASNAAAAAVDDCRFAPLVAGELDAIEIAVSLLSAAIPLVAASEPELVAKLRPGIDGLLLREERRQALFLPQVWEHLTQPAEFLAQLKAKAGLPRDHWSVSLEFRRFTAASIAEPATTVAR